MAATVVWSMIARAAGPVVARPPRGLTKATDRSQADRQANAFWNIESRELNIVSRGALITVAYPVIVGGGKQAARFNVAFEQFARAQIDNWKKELVEEDSVSLLPEVRLNTARLVTVVFSGWWIPRKAAHGHPLRLARTYDFSRGKTLELNEIFVSGSRWVSVLSRAAERKLAQNPRYDEWWHGCEKCVRSRGCWTFTRDGAILTFPEYAVAPSYIGEVEVRFTWEELRPVLRKNGPLPPMS